MIFVPTLSDCPVRELLPHVVRIDDSDSPRWVEVDVGLRLQIRLPDGELVECSGVVCFKGFPSDGDLGLSPAAGAAEPAAEAIKEGTNEHR